MKAIITSLLLFICCSCYGQETQFGKYLSGFQAVNPPLLINNENRQSIFPGSIWDEPYAIASDYLHKYVILNIEQGTGDDYGFGYGVAWNIDAYTVVIIRRQKDMGDNLNNFDLLENKLIVYDKNGNYIDDRYISKDNEVWFSSINILSPQRIEVEQIKMLIDKGSLIDIEKEQRGEVVNMIYEIDSSGKIKGSITKNYEANLRWNSEASIFQICN